MISGDSSSSFAMSPEQTAAAYDRIAAWWGQEHCHSSYGVKPLLRAISFAKAGGRALDVGCGSSGRFIEVLRQQGFTVEGLDASPEMIALARERHPDGVFHVAEISSWTFPGRYDLISAWDSTFHLPLDLQEPALRRMCEGLAADGILIHTFGGVNEPGEITGSFQGEAFGYSSLGVTRNLELLARFGCVCKHLEFDQGPEERHVYCIAQKLGEAAS